MFIGSKEEAKVIFQEIQQCIYYASHQEAFVLHAITGYKAWNEKRIAYLLWLGLITPGRKGSAIKVSPDWFRIWETSTFLQTSIMEVIS